MIPMDDPKTRQVWSRVMNVPCPQADEQKDSAPLSEKQLAALAQDEWQDAAAYRSLLRCAPNCAQEALRQLAQEETCHARQLAALYFLASGKKLCPAPTRPVCTACFNETLRQRHAQELETQKRYCTLAQRGGEHACIFERLARDEGRLARLLFELLQRTL